MFGTLIDYWYYTGDETYNEVTMQAIQHQVGLDQDFMPENQTNTLGNDDQGFWALSAMMAVETNFENPPEDQPQWLALVQAVFNEYVERWNEETVCDGGLRWQIFPFNNGFNYKNSISNGCFFNLAARLARYTGNETYGDWAGTVWSWMEKHEFIDKQFNVYDGAQIKNDCNDHDSTQWSYNAGIFLQGAAMMYNFTGGDERWESRVKGLLSRTREHFFEPDGVVVERACEPSRTCNLDQQTFKGYLMRWMASTAQMVPFAFEDIMPLIKTNAEAAAQQCSGTTGAPEFKGQPGTACGFSWQKRAEFDGLVGVGEQMSALSAMQYSLIRADTPTALTADTGGTSEGNPGGGAPTMDKMPHMEPIGTKDRVAAGFLTTAVVLGVLGGSAFLIKE